MATQLVQIKNTIETYKEDFKNIPVNVGDDIHFEKEAQYAIQAMERNKYLASTALKNPTSMRHAVMNIAATGLSLNGALKQAYLVPRGGAVVLDISYIGLCKLACESGFIRWIQAELVYSKDSFIHNGVGVKPDHGFNPFLKPEDRGEIIGCYVTAKTEDGEFLTTSMPTHEIHAIRDRTEAWKAFKAGKVKSCPWSTDEGEMMKKTVIKRAFKTWPQNSKRMALAVKEDEINNGIDFKKEQEQEKATPEQVETITRIIGLMGRTIEAFIPYAKDITRATYEINTVEDIGTKDAEIIISNIKKYDAIEGEVVNENV